jgi:hypothetical protein
MCSILRLLCCLLFLRLPPPPKKPKRPRLHNPNPPRPDDPDIYITNDDPRLCRPRYIPESPPLRRPPNAIPNPILIMHRQQRLKPTWTTDYAALAHETRSEIETAEKGLGRAKRERRYGRDVCEDDDIRRELGVAKRELYAVKARYEWLETEATRLQGVRGTRPDDALVSADARSHGFDGVDMVKCQRCLQRELEVWVQKWLIEKFDVYKFFIQNN